MIIKPPNRYFSRRHTSVFLAGTIDNGNSVDWQSRLATKLQNRFKNIDIYNPRRDSWNQNCSKTELADQIYWELDYLDKVDIIYFNFLKDSRSPVTMLELGMALAKDKNIIIVAPPEFYRYDNVAITSLVHGKSICTDESEGYERLVVEISRNYKYG